MQVLAVRKKLLGEEHPDVAQSLTNLAAFYNSQGRYEEAEPLLLQAVQIVEKKLKKNHPTRIYIYNKYQELINSRINQLSKLKIIIKNFIEKLLT